jgi:hypothetical protein
MSSEFQTIAALLVVALAASWLVLRALRQRRAGGGCSGGDCPAVSRDVKALQARLRSR